MKIIFKTLLITILILVVALLAAPVFVRQEQVKNFVENRIALPDGRKLKLVGNIDFGFFPKAYVNVPEANILYKDGAKKTFKDFHFGFNPADLMGKGVGFETAFFFGDNQYEGHIYIKEYENFYKNGTSPIKLDIEKPLKIKANGDFSHTDNKYALSNFKITHKQTTAKGNLVINGTGNAQSISLQTVIQSEDIENIRRIIEFGKVNNDEFNLLSGQGTVTLGITAKGNNAEQLKSSLNGEGTVKIQEAAIYGLDLNEIIGAPQEVKLTDNEDKKIDIKDADSKFNIVNGAIRVEELNATNQFANITGQGIVDITKSALKLSVDVDADVASARVKIPLIIYGTFDDIKFAPRFGDAMINNLETIIDQTKKIKLENIKIDFNKGDVGGAVQQLRDIGKGLGVDLDKLTNGATKDLGAPATETAPANVPASPAAPAQPAAPAAPASLQQVPASMQNNSQPQQ